MMNATDSIQNQDDRVQHHADQNSSEYNNITPKNHHTALLARHHSLHHWPFYHLPFNRHLHPKEPQRRLNIRQALRQWPPTLLDLANDTVITHRHRSKLTSLSFNVRPHSADTSSINLQARIHNLIRHISVTFTFFFFCHSPNANDRPSLAALTLLAKSSTS